MTLAATVIPVSEAKPQDFDRNFLYLGYHLFPTKKLKKWPHYDYCKLCVVFSIQDALSNGKDPLDFELKNFKGDLIYSLTLEELREILGFSEDEDFEIKEGNYTYRLYRRGRFANLAIFGPDGYKHFTKR